MNHKALRHAFSTAFDAAERLQCADLHHPQKWQHADDELCPAEYHLAKQIKIARDHVDNDFRATNGNSNV